MANDSIANEIDVVVRCVGVRSSSVVLVFWFTMRDVIAVDCGSCFFLGMSASDRCTDSLAVGAVSDDSKNLGYSSSRKCKSDIESGVGLARSQHCSF